MLIACDKAAEMGAFAETTRQVSVTFSVIMANLNLAGIIAFDSIVASAFRVEGLAKAA
jgi:hypothetical protein